MSEGFELLHPVEPLHAHSGLHQPLRGSRRGFSHLRWLPRSRSIFTPDDIVLYKIHIESISLGDLEKFRDSAIQFCGISGDDQDCFQLLHVLTPSCASFAGAGRSERRYDIPFGPIEGSIF